MQSFSKIKILGLIVIVTVATGWLVTRQSTIADEVLLPIPFTDQAPTGKWDRNEDCEETSITMANAYLNENYDEILPPAVALKYINSLKQWEGNNIGYNADTGAYATSRMAEGAFNINVKQIKDYTEEDLKRALSNKHPVLLPIDARLLGNPAYAESGPDYHMIVVRGYSDAGVGTPTGASEHSTNFIVNDPGTQSGNSNVYSFATLQKAAADWNNAAKIMDHTIKIALVLSK